MNIVLNIVSPTRLSLKRNDVRTEFGSAKAYIEFAAKNRIFKINVVSSNQKGDNASTLDLLCLEALNAGHNFRPNYLGAPFINVTPTFSNQETCEVDFIGKSYTESCGWYLTITRGGKVQSFQKEPHYLENLDVWYMKQSGGAYNIYDPVEPQDQPKSKKVPGSKQKTMTDLDIFLLQVHNLPARDDDTILYKGSLASCMNTIKYLPELWDMNFRVCKSKGLFHHYIRRVG